MAQDGFYRLVERLPGPKAHRRHRPRRLAQRPGLRSDRIHSFIIRYTCFFLIYAILFVLMAFEASECQNSE